MNTRAVISSRAVIDFALDVGRNASEMKMVMENAPDLTQRPPRSPRVRLGGYALLPRMLDKCRATIIGKNGEYHYACPLDQRFIDFVGIDPEALKAELANGISDSEALAWIEAHAVYKHAPFEIAQWTAFNENRVPSDVESREFFNKLHKEAGSHRTDIVTLADLLDLDDYVSYGGKP